MGEKRSLLVSSFHHAPDFDVFDWAKLLNDSFASDAKEAKTMKDRRFEATDPVSSQ